MLEMVAKLVGRYVTVGSFRFVYSVGGDVTSPGVWPSLRWEGVERRGREGG